MTYKVYPNFLRFFFSNENVHLRANAFSFKETEF